jgi:hypothetical protein
MRSLETTVMCYFWDYNLELTIGLQGLGLVPGVRLGLGAGLVQGTTPSTYTRDKRACLPRPDPVACRPSPLPVYSAHIYSRRSGGGLQPSPHVAGGPGCTGSSLWIFLAMAGVFAVPGASIPVHKCACLLSLLPLWGRS